MDEQIIFNDIKSLLKRKGWKEQTSGEVYMNGTLGINFWKGYNIIHVSLNWYADEEQLEALYK